MVSWRGEGRVRITRWERMGGLAAVVVVVQPWAECVMEVAGVERRMVLGWREEARFWAMVCVPGEG